MAFSNFLEVILNATHWNLQETPGCTLSASTCDKFSIMSQTVMHRYLDPWDSQLTVSLVSARLLSQACFLKVMIYYDRYHDCYAMIVVSTNSTLKITIGWKSAINCSGYFPWTRQTLQEIFRLSGSCHNKVSLLCFDKSMWYLNRSPFQGFPHHVS